MNITISENDGRHTVLFGRPAGPSILAANLTRHDLDDLLAVLEQRKAAGRYCDTPSGEHTCVMPPGHAILPHTCRACDHHWQVTP